MIKFSSGFLWNIRYLIGLIAIFSITALLWLPNSFKKKEVEVPVLAKDEIILVRTPGGMLEVGTLVRNEEFKWSTEYTCPLIDCGKLLGKTISELRVPVHYTYRIPLAAEWKLKFRDSYYELVVPPEEPKLPPAIDLSKLQLKTDGKWLSPNVAANQASLLKNFSPLINKKAKQKVYIDAQREQAKKTIAEFARKWMLEQKIENKKINYPIKVFIQGNV